MLEKGLSWPILFHAGIDVWDNRTVGIHPDGFPLQEENGIVWSAWLWYGKGHENALPNELRTQVEYDAEWGDADGYIGMQTNEASCRTWKSVIKYRYELAPRFDGWIPVYNGINPLPIKKGWGWTLRPLGAGKMNG